MWCGALVTTCLILAGQLGWGEAADPDRLACKPGDSQPTTRVNTTERLAKFRAEMANISFDGKPLAAFIVRSEDAHYSEYPTEHDRRRAYISGFEGSAGTAVVTRDKAALWTDGRYFLEADEVLDCNWILMRSGLPETPSIADWLNSVMTAPEENIGEDRTLISYSTFNSMRDSLAAKSSRSKLQASATNPVDIIWTVASGRPPQPTNPINALPMSFAGKSWQDKIQNLRENLTAKGADAFVVTSLDELAWLFNLRGDDIAYNPFFVGYAIVEMDRVRLYILDKYVRLAANATDNATTENMHTHLRTSITGSCTSMPSPCVEVLEYNQTAVEEALTSLSNASKVWITYTTNYAIYDSISEANRIIDKSPIALDKSMKNEVERAGMQNAYNRDSAAVIKFLAFMEKQIEAGEEWTEVSAHEELDRRRRQLPYNRGLSFETISGYGSNGAIIHYRPLPATDKAIGTDSLFLLDSGGQYLDGTTDTTRTMHYGTPTAYQKECYTRVLMGVINLAMLKWPKGLYGSQIDALTRAPLWDVGLVYRHGTGHGIGAYLSVHEGPGRIGMAPSVSSSQEPLYPYQYYSDEPGYYEDGEFGIRLETVVTIVPVTTKYDTSGEQFLGFKPVCYVPFEPKLIDYSMLNDAQIAWLNKYNKDTRDTILPLLQGDQLAINWFNARTQQIDSSEIRGTCSASHIFSHVSLILALIATVLRLVA